MAFEIETGIEKPAATRTFKGEAKYPFERLEVGQSFFVGDDEVQSGDARKTMFGAVSSAHDKFAVVSPDGAMRTVQRGPNKGAEVPLMIKTRVFSVRPATKDGRTGARVFRDE